MTPVSFKILDGFYAKYNEPVPPISQVNGHWETSDMKWLQEAEAAGVIERLDTQQLKGIIKITIVEGAIESDPVKYIFDVDYGERGTIVLEQGDLLRFSKFREKYAAIFQKILPSIRNDMWEAVITPLLEHAERIKDDTNESPIILEVINKIRTAETVNSKDELFTGAGNKKWIDNTVDTLYMLSREFEPIADKYHIERRRLVALLFDNLKEKSKVIRYKSKLHRVWGFRPGRFKDDDGE